VRRKFANAPSNLIAVSASENREKVLKAQFIGYLTTWSIVVNTGRCRGENNGVGSCNHVFVINTLIL